MNLDDRSCAVCAKSQLTAETSDLECRASPPVQDLARYARFPTVRPDHYCHEFERDPSPGAREEISQ